MLCRVCCRSVPYAFRHLPLQDLPPGYPVYLDINLSQEGAQTWLSWLQEGLLLDESTRGLVAHLITYNSDLKIFGAVKVSFDFQQGGSIKVRAQHAYMVFTYNNVPRNMQDCHLLHCPATLVA